MTRSVPLATWLARKGFWIHVSMLRFSEGQWHLKALHIRCRNQTSGPQFNESCFVPSTLQRSKSLVKWSPLSKGRLSKQVHGFQVSWLLLCCLTYDVTTVCWVWGILSGNISRDCFSNIHPTQKNRKKREKEKRWERPRLGKCVTYNPWPGICSEILS